MNAIGSLAGKVAEGYVIQHNASFGPLAGVTYTQLEHAIGNGLLNVMIEVRNDLVREPARCSAIARDLAGWIERAVAALASARSGESRV